MMTLFEVIVPVLSVSFVNITHLSNWRTLLIEVVAAMVTWKLVYTDMISNEQLMKLHRNYFITLYTIVFAGVFFNAAILSITSLNLVIVYIFVSLSMLLFGEKPARAVGIFITMLIFIHFNLNIWFLIEGLVSTAVASFTLRKVYRRIDVLKSALIMAIFEVVIYSLKFLVLNYFNLRELALAVFNPFASVVVIVGVLPYIEYTSRIYSNIGLMELGNLNHPLLKLLSMKAPGTYQHSTFVANLAEAAAESIGANSLLARVASYYHDIGKTKRPMFFIENQFSGENPHDNISPYLSHLILDEHVKYGKQLARKYRLPITIESVIEEHHGSRIQLYFYHKAKMENPNVSEDEFRYPGRKPRFKESGIIMLADSVEAATRSLSGKKTLSHIRSVVEKTVMSILAERQLDDSGLTLQELEMIIEEFSKRIASFYHKRIEYPKEEVEVELINGAKK